MSGHTSWPTRWPECTASSSSAERSPSSADRAVLRHATGSMVVRGPGRCAVATPTPPAPVARHPSSEVMGVDGSRSCHSGRTPKRSRRARHRRGWSRRPTAPRRPAAPPAGGGRAPPSARGWFGHRPASVAARYPAGRGHHRTAMAGRASTARWASLVASHSSSSKPSIAAGNSSISSSSMCAARA